MSHRSQAGSSSIRAQICHMGYWGQKMAVGFPVGFATLAAFGLAYAVFSLTVATYAAGIVAYTGLVFAYAWIDKRMYFLSSQDPRSWKMIALIHLFIVGALVGILYLILRFDPAIVPDARNDIKWPTIGVFIGIFLIMYGEISWLSGGRSVR